MFPFLTWFKKSKKPMFGIDISHHNGDIDWNRIPLNNPKVDFVFIKATQGTTYVDPKFYQNALGCRKARAPFSFYHFATLNDYNVKQDSANEANFFISVIKKSLAPQLPLVLDIEIEDQKVQLDTYAVLNWITTFFDTLKTNGYSDIMIYSGTPFLNAHLPKDHGLSEIPLWLAAYTSNPVPKLPIGWNSYTIWQYTDKGKITGINGNVDLNKTLLPLY